MPQTNELADGRLIDGQFDWSGGVNSSKVKTISSPSYPTGLARNQLAWLNNAGVRGGGILQRTGWKPLVQGASWHGLFQGAWMHQPDFADPHIIMSVGGRIFQVRVDTDNSVHNLSTAFGQINPADEPQAYFTQAEQFTIIQAGDYLSSAPNKPLFWESETPLLRRSNGFIGIAHPNNEIPEAGPMDYYGQRLWYAFGRFYAAGDIVFGAAGTVAYDKRDSVLHVTENPIAKGGDAFIVPTAAGNIRALKHTSNLDTALGESPLFIFTRSTVYATQPPADRTAWIATTVNNMPIQRVVLVKGGTFGDRGVVPVNGDMFYPSIPNGDIRSFAMALRYFQQPGNIPISANVNRVLQFNDRSKLRYASGIQFDNRLWQTVLPQDTPVGVGFKAIIPLDFDPIGSLEERLPPAWEGVYEGLTILQLLVGDFGGRERAFGVIYSQITGTIEIWEFTLTDRFDQTVNRVEWQIEFPAYTWGDLFALKELDTADIWIDKMLGTVDFRMDYRPDQFPCWLPWHAWTQCTAKDCEQDTEGPGCGVYPVDIKPFCESFKPAMRLPKPKPTCIKASNLLSTQAYQFQLRLTIKGWCRIRGLLAYALPRGKKAYEGLVCV